MKGLLNSFREIARYPSAILGLVIILLLILVAIYAVVTIPYSEAVRLWRGGEDVWYNTPRSAMPAWVNVFRGQRLPETIIIKSTDEDTPKTTESAGEGMTSILMSFPFEYTSREFPDEVSVYFKSSYAEKVPYVSLTWLTPDGRDLRVADFSISRSFSYRAGQDAKLERRLGRVAPRQGLFAAPDSDPLVALPGNYELKVEALVFEPDADVDAELVVYGKVYGLAGTDHLRRDLMVPLLWGTPVALSFGLLAAVGTTVTTMIIAGIGTWFSGWVDALVQRITQVNLILPFLPILIMVGTFYSKSLWTMLGMTILLSIFGGSILTYRAVFIQVKESPYIEAARAYGASNTRVIFGYLIPRMIPLLIPQLVVLVPTYVFPEASLAVLGLGDPTLPTWGKVINDAYSNGALYQGQYYWVLEPAVLLMITGLAFALVGFSLDRVFNPRLRGL
ncbi:MAG TPA: ABC transporter permease [Anaerolineae bacterium]|nr:ABC transporter permease [Anaerolineae bacterium]